MPDFEFSLLCYCIFKSFGTWHRAFGFWFPTLGGNMVSLSVGSNSPRKVACYVSCSLKFSNCNDSVPACCNASVPACFHHSLPLVSNSMCLTGLLTKIIAPIMAVSFTYVISVMIWLIKVRRYRALDVVLKFISYVMDSRIIFVEGYFIWYYKVNFLNTKLVLFHTFITANAVFVLLVVDAASVANLFPTFQDEWWSRNVGTNCPVSQHPTAQELWQLQSLRKPNTLPTAVFFLLLFRHIYERQESLLELRVEDRMVTRQQTGDRGNGVWLASDVQIFPLQRV
jgi:hypothetical protein